MGEDRVAEEVSEGELARVYFVVSSKEGEASLSIEHNPARQSLLLPVYPESAVEDALELLYPEVAHYAAQWEKAMVRDLDRDAEGFSVLGDEMPRGIAPVENADALTELARRYVGPKWRPWLEEPSFSAMHVNREINPGNTCQIAHEVEIINKLDITPLDGVD